MAASDQDQSPETPARPIALLSPAATAERLQEEINRASRQALALSCLLVTIGNLEELTHEHGSELSEQALAYVGGALRPQLRDFDRVGRASERELLLILPGADGPRGEIVARRALERLRTIKVEIDGTRQPLRISLGLATWTTERSAEELLAQARSAAQREPGSGTSPPLATASPPALGRPDPA